jgi:PAS domain S-box-containing protein
MKKFGFKTQILLPAAALLCILVAGFLYGMWNLHLYHLRKDFSKRVQSAQRLLNDKSETDLRVLTSVLDVLCRDKKLVALWRQHDREALMGYSQLLFKKIRDNYGITHFYFHENDRTCFLRVHQTDRYGDVIQRESLLQAQKSGCLGAGIELGPLGTLTLRAVQPWVIDGRVEGYIEFGEEIAHITKEISSILNVNVTVLIDKTYLDREGWINGMAMHEYASNWEDFPQEVILDCQPAGITPKMLSSISSLQENSLEKAVEIKVSGKPYLAGSIRLFDIRNRDVGRMVMFENIAPEQASLQFLLFNQGKFFFFIVAVCLFGAYFFMVHIERHMNKSHRQILQANAEFKSTQDKYLKEIRQFRLVFECSTDAIAILGLDRQLLFVNPAFERLFGYTREEANAQGGTKNLYTNQQHGIKAYLMVSQGREFSGEIQMLTKENHNVQVFLRASPIVDGDGNMFGILAVYNDLTERKSIERELLR